MAKIDSKKAKAFYQLIALGKIDKVKTEIERGFDLSVLFDFNGTGEFSTTTPLQWALRKKQYDVAKLILESGADAAQPDLPGYTALHRAGEPSFIDLLVARGADVNARAKNGETPLHWAYSAPTIEALIKHGANVDAEDNEGVTPYLKTDDPKVRALLKKHGAKGLTVTNGQGLTARESEATPKQITKFSCVGADDSGALWLGGAEPMYRADGDQVGFMFRLEGDRLSRFEIGGFGDSAFLIPTCFARGPGRTLYFGTPTGLLRFDGTEFRLFSTATSELHHNRVTSLASDSKGKLYILCHEEDGEEDRSIAIFDGKTFTFLRPSVDFPKGLNFICLAVDADDSLFVGCEDGQLLRVADGAKLVKKFKGQINDIVAQGKTLWVATIYGVSDAKSSKLLSVGYPNVLCADGEDLWVGTSDGLARIRKGEPTLFDTKNSKLPEGSVEGLARTSNGIVWVLAGGVLARVRDGVIEPAFAPSTPKVAKKKLVAMPQKPLVARAKVPAEIVKQCASAKLEGVASEQLLSLLRPAISFDLEPKGKSVAPGVSKFGGLPDLPSSAKWPSLKSSSLPFLMQVNLADVQTMDVEGLLPKKGVLSFFCDTSQDFTGMRVVYSEASAKLARRALPEDLEDRKDQSDFVAEFPEHKLKFGPIWTLPSLDFLEARAALTKNDETALYRLTEFLSKRKGALKSGSRLLGWPESAQEDVVTSEKEIALLQLQGSELSPKGIETFFEGWCMDGLVHGIVAASALGEKQFGKVRANMAYT